MSRREALRRALSDFDALYGEGAARRELAVGIVASAALIFNVIGLIVALGAGS